MFIFEGRKYRRINLGACRYPEIYSEKSDYMMEEKYIIGTALLKMFNAVPQAAETIFNNKDAIDFFNEKYPFQLQVLRDLVSVFKREVSNTDNLKRYNSFYDALLDVENKYLEYIEDVCLRYELKEPLLREDYVIELEQNAGVLSSGLREYEEGFLACLDMIAEGELPLEKIIN